MFDVTPDPVAFRIGPLDVYWYGIAYAVGLVAVYFLLTRLARRAGRNPEVVGNGMIVVAVAALAGGRLYHVIDQWQLYANDPLRIILPPYSGLGVYGGLVTGTIAAWMYTRWIGEPFLRWADIIAPGLFLMQVIGRWGNFFNQELYGPPTTLPWGIPIDCTHRLVEYACQQFPFETTRFHPLFLYESVSGLLGLAFLLFLGSRFRDRLRPGDILLAFFIWYGIVRFGLETFRTENWTFFGVPTAMLVSALFVVAAAAVLVYRHRPGHPKDDEAPEDDLDAFDDDASDNDLDELDDDLEDRTPADGEAPHPASS
jgi:phosphatidylglycerol:prolipoprotein diacylglycerol transferase